jgi:hypothetical protein
VTAQVGGDVGARGGRLGVARGRVQQGQHHQARRAQERQGVADGARRFHAAVPGDQHRAATCANCPPGGTISTGRAALSIT